MMHELLTGEPPFMANDKMRLKRLVLGFKGMSGNSTLDPAAKKIRADFKKDNVSATAQDLIIKLLNPKGKQRITASNAMEEPWLAKPAALGKANMMSTKKFHKNNHMAVLHKTKVHSQLTNADKYLDEVVDRHSTTKLLASVIRKDDATRMEDILAQLLDPDTDINTCDGNGVTPLMHALHKKDLEVVKMLVNAENLDGTSRINNWGMSKGHEYETALILAVRHGAPQQPGWRMVVKDMLEHRADPNQKATGELTPLLVMAAEGSDLTPVDGYPEPDLEPDPELLDLLLKHKADPRQAEVCGYTPLSFAAGNGFEAMVVRLLKNDPAPEINKADTEGNTALMEAASNGKVEIVRMLVNAGADKCKKNHKDITANEFLKSYSEEVKHSVDTAQLINLKKTESMLGSEPTAAVNAEQSTAAKVSHDRFGCCTDIQQSGRCCHM